MDIIVKNVKWDKELGGYKAYEKDGKTYSFIGEEVCERVITMPLRNAITLIRHHKDAHQEIKAKLSGEPITTNIDGELFIVYTKE